ncbi:MAG: class I tRNA ligase family protein, partial [Clostridia bacterium]|nr:class I tRNA ligase family protein [Clostridia bacterium]
AVSEGQRKVMGTLWNTYAFFVLYANIDNFDASKYELDYSSLSTMDKWCLSKMQSMVKGVDENLENYRIPEAAKYIAEFVDELSNWYVRRCRERFWATDLTQDKINAYMTLYTALVTTAKVAAPMIPFITEDIYQNLVRENDKDAPESVHLCSYPEVKAEWIDEGLEANMEEVLQIVGLGRACRNGSNIKNRQPLARMFVKANKELDAYCTDIIKDELNIKEVIFVDDASDLLSYSFKPQMRTLGPKYGPQLNEIREKLQALDGTKAKAELDETGVLKLNISIGDIELTADDLLIETKQQEGFYSLSDFGVTVAIDTTLTEDLITEGFVREIISKVQTMRKDAGFEVMDRINIYVDGSERIKEIAANNKSAIMGDVLCDEIIIGKPEGYTADWNINGEEATLGVKKN